MEFKVAPLRAALVLLTGVGVAALAYVAVVWLRMRYGYDYAAGVFQLFEFDRSPNVPSWYTALLFVCAAGASVMTALEAADRRQSYYWWAAAAVLIVLSQNEVIGLGYLAVEVSTNAIGIDNKTALWGASALGALTALVFVPLLVRSPIATSVALIAAAVMFVGAVGLGFARAQTAEGIAHAPFHLLDDAQWFKVRQDWLYVSQAAGERLLKMLAPIAVVYGALQAMSREGTHLALRIVLTTRRTNASELLQPRTAGRDDE